MHIPDGVLEPRVWAPLCAVSASAVALAARAARRRLADESIPLVGLMGAFVFALQMVNFPIGAGVSDHIVGAGLLAIAFGPGIAVLAMSAVVVIQAMLFGDGGVAALGANVFDMAVASVLVAFVAHRALAPRLPAAYARAAVAAATFAGVMAGAAGAAAWIMLSKPYGTKFLVAMALTHAVSGAVEAIVTAEVVRVLRAADMLPEREPTNA